jgi:hypothetical protein
MSVVVRTNNQERTIIEMDELFRWCLSTFGIPGNELDSTWMYGKTPDWTGSSRPNGPWDVEWIEFRNDRDATLFSLRWGL